MATLSDYWIEVFKSRDVIGRDGFVGTFWDEVKGYYEEIDTLRAALAFYADEATYVSQTVTTQEGQGFRVDFTDVPAIAGDRGERARKALGKDTDQQQR